ELVGIDSPVNRSLSGNDQGQQEGRDHDHTVGVHIEVDVQGVDLNFEEDGEHAWGPGESTFAFQRRAEAAGSGSLGPRPAIPTDASILSESERKPPSGLGILRGVPSQGCSRYASQ